VYARVYNIRCRSKCLAGACARRLFTPHHVTNPITHVITNPITNVINNLIANVWSKSFHSSM
jgi:hypothetical protein